MPRSKKSTASATVTKSAIDHATSTLEDLPEKPKENWSLREAVAHLQVEISSALSKGYSYEEIARMLTEKGIEISASSLKSYLSAAKRQKETAAPKTGRTGRRSRKALGENLMVIEAVPAQTSSNGTAPKPSKSSSKAKQEPTSDSGATNGAAPTKRRTRSSSKSETSSTQKTAASKTAAKSKSTAKATKGTRGKRQKQA